MGRLLRFTGRGRGRWPRGTRSDARTDTLFPSDARPADEPPPGKAPDPDRERRRRLVRGLTGFALGTVFVATSVGALVGDRGYFALRRARQELADLNAFVDKKQTEVTELRRVVDRLKTDAVAVERIAREELGFVKPGEITYLLPSEEGRAPGVGLSLPPKEVRKLPGSAVDVPRD